MHYLQGRQTLNNLEAFWPYKCLAFKGLDMKYVTERDKKFKGTLKANNKLSYSDGLVLENF